MYHSKTWLGISADWRSRLWLKHYVLLKFSDKVFLFVHCFWVFNCFCNLWLFFFLLFVLFLFLWVRSCYVIFLCYTLDENISLLLVCKRDRYTCKFFPFSIGFFSERAYDLQDKQEVTKIVSPWKNNCMLSTKVWDCRLRFVLSFPVSGELMHVHER